MGITAPSEIWREDEHEDAGMGELALLQMGNCLADAGDTPVEVVSHDAQCRGQRDVPAHYKQMRTILCGRMLHRPIAQRLMGSAMVIRVGSDMMAQFSRSIEGHFQNTMMVSRGAI